MIPARINNMATRKVELGPTGETVRHNIRRIRDAHGMTLKGLSVELARRQRPLSHTVLSQMETGGRRVDVDDLVAIAAALDTNPNALLFPATRDPGAELLTAAGRFAADDVWAWADGEQSLELTRAVDRIDLKPEGYDGPGAEYHTRRRVLFERMFQQRTRPGHTDNLGPNVTTSGDA